MGHPHGTPVGEVTRLARRRCDLSRAAEQSADIDKSGFVDKEELGRVIKVQLNVQLQDPINDLDIIFGR
jgi:hypothetical protein